MAVGFDAVSTGFHHQVAGAFGGSVTETNVDSITIAAGASLAVAYFTTSISGNSGTDIAISNVTIAGVTATQWPGFRGLGFGGTNSDGITDAWYAISPGSGTQHVTYTVTGSTAGSLDYESIVIIESYTGSDLTTPVATAVKGTGNGVSSITASVTGMAAADMCAGIGANGSAAPGVTTGTLDRSITGTGSSGSDNATAAHNTGTGTVTIVWSTNSGDESQYAAGRIIAASVATSATRPPDPITGPGAQNPTFAWQWRQNQGNDATITVSASANADVANITFTANDVAGFNNTASAGNATVTFTANNAAPTTAESALAGNATVTFVANNTAGNNNTAAAGNATVTFTANNAVGTNAESATAGNATVSFTANNAAPTGAGNASAGNATVSFTANNASALTGAVAFAGNATVTFTANDATNKVSLSALAGNATVSFTANNAAPTSNVSPAVKPQLEIVGSLNRLAATVGLEMQGAANSWAGTSQKATNAALNAKAVTAGLEFNGAIKDAVGDGGGDSSEDAQGGLNTL